MEKAQEILLHIDELYTENPSEDKIRQMAENNPTRYQAWVDAFRDYDLPDVLTAIDNFWEFKSSKTKPNVAQIKAILTSHKAEKLRQAAASEPKKELPTGYFYWKQDGERGDLKYYPQDYEQAFDLCINDYLKQVVPVDVVERSSWVRKIKLAIENGVLNRMSEALQEVCPTPRFMSDNEYYSLPENANKRRYEMTSDDAVKTLSAHWRAA